MADIIEQYTGDFKSRALEEIMGDAERLRIILRQNNGKKEVLFTGSKFSEKDFQRRITGSYLLERKQQKKSKKWKIL